MLVSRAAPVPPGASAGRSWLLHEGCEGVARRGLLAPGRGAVHGPVQTEFGAHLLLLAERSDMRAGGEASGGGEARGVVDSLAVRVRVTVLSGASNHHVQRVVAAARDACPYARAQRARVSVITPSGMWLLDVGPSG